MPAVHAARVWEGSGSTRAKGRGAATTAFPASFDVGQKLPARPSVAADPSLARRLIGGQRQFTSYSSII